MSTNTLKVAAQNNDTNSLYSVLQHDPHVLDRIDTIPFVETPLHIAASLGHLEFATEIMVLKPSFAVKLNLQGLTPLHLAVHNGKREMVRRLLQSNKDLVRVKGTKGHTPLHLASEKGEAKILNDLLEACPNSIEDVTGRGETALHVTVSNGHFDALKVLVDWLMKNTGSNAVELERTILNWKDEEGNTVLHAAASHDDIRAIKLLMKRSKFLNIDAENSKGETASNTTNNQDIKKRLNYATAAAVVSMLSPQNIILYLTVYIKKWLIRYWGLREVMSEDVRNACLVVAGLVVTTTYQAAISPPSGLHSGDVGTNSTLTQAASNEGKSVMSNEMFISFQSINMCAFILSVVLIIGLLPKNIASFLLAIPMCILQVSYYVSIIQTSPTLHASKVIGVVYVVVLLSSMMVVLPLVSGP